MTKKITKTEEQIEQEIAEEKERSRERIKALRNEKRRAQYKAKSEDRKKRDHALIVFGSIIEEACGGDWRSIDVAELYCIFNEDDAIKEVQETLCLHPGRTVEEADAAIRSWEKLTKEEKLNMSEEESEEVSDEEALPKEEDEIRFPEQPQQPPRPQPYQQPQPQPQQNWY